MKYILERCSPMNTWYVVDTFAAHNEALRAAANLTYTFMAEEHRSPVLRIVMPEPKYRYYVEYQDNCDDEWQQFAPQLGASFDSKEEAGAWMGKRASITMTNPHSTGYRITREEIK